MSGKFFRPGDPVFDAPLPADAERQLGIELSGGGWAALLGEDDDSPDDWDSAAECDKAAQRAQSRLDRDAKAASDRVTAAVSRSKLAEADCGHLAARDHQCTTCSLCLGCCECENFGDHYLQRGSITWRTWCAEHGDWHSAPSLEELRALIRQMHRNEDAEVGEDFSRAAREDDR